MKEPSTGFLLELMAALREIKKPEVVGPIVAESVAYVLSNCWPEWFEKCYGPRILVQMTDRMSAYEKDSSN